MLIKLLVVELMVHIIYFCFLNLILLPIWRCLEQVAWYEDYSALILIRMQSQHRNMYPVILLKQVLPERGYEELPCIVCAPFGNQK